MDRKSNFRSIVLHVLGLILFLSLISCVYSRALGSHKHAWRPGGHKKHKFISDLPWDPPLKKREHQLRFALNESDECCLSVTEIVQPVGGVSRSGKVVELYRDHNSTQSFYQTSCAEGVKGRPCRYVDDEIRWRTACVQRYTYTYALVREFDSLDQWKLDYIRVKSGCSCEVSLGNEIFRKRKRQFSDEVL